MSGSSQMFCFILFSFPDFLAGWIKTSVQQPHLHTAVTKLKPSRLESSRGLNPSHPGFYFSALFRCDEMGFPTQTAHVSACFASMTQLLPVKVQPTGRDSSGTAHL